MGDARDVRLDELELRRQAATKAGQIDNGSLPAGQPMYYYCKACGIHVATLPEDWWKDPPPTYCVNCKDLVADGVIARKDTYEEWLSKWPATSPSPDTTTTP
jgi:hypothetical protein